MNDNYPFTRIPDMESIEDFLSSTDYLSYTVYHFDERRFDGSKEEVIEYLKNTEEVVTIFGNF